MVAQYYGHDIDLSAMRRRFSISQMGSTLQQLMDISGRLDLVARAVKAEPQQIGLLNMPALLHWDERHFVVLKQVRGKRVEILDPGAGQQTLTWQELANHYSGVALELTPSPEFQARKEHRRINLWRLFGRISGLKRVLLQILVFSLALQLFALATPFFMQLVVDEVLISEDRKLLFVLGTGFALLGAINVVVTAARSWLLIYVGNTLRFQMLGSLYRHLLRLPLQYFEKRQIGDIVSRFDSMRTVQETLTDSSVEVLIDGLMVSATLALMYVYSPVLATLTVVVIGMYAFIRAAMYRVQRTAAEAAVVRMAKARSNFLESLRGMATIKVFGKEIVRHAVWQNLFAVGINAEIRSGRLQLWSTAANGLVFGLGNVAVIWVGAAIVLSGAMSVGMLFAFMSYKQQFVSRAGALIDKSVSFAMLSLHAERISDIALSDIESSGAHRAGQAPAHRALELENVWFRYADGDPWVLQGSNLAIESGECVAIVGPSGRGKTTLVKIMLGLLRPERGRVMMDGRDLCEWDLADYRKQVAAVMQEDQLFAGSIAENISFFDPQADLGRIEECAALAAIHDDVMRMPMAYHTLVGEMGSVLSGGQKQRVILARALYHQPRVLFMDEATSHLDVECERCVNDAIAHLQMTRVVIAHRAETIRSATRIISLPDFQTLNENRRNRSHDGRLEPAQPHSALVPPARSA